MIGRSPGRLTVLAVSLLCSGLLAAGYVTHPSAAVAAGIASPGPTHVVLFQSEGNATEHATTAQTVGAFLRSRGITVHRGDFVRPELDEPIVDNTIVQYSPARSVILRTPNGRRTVRTTASDVGALLEEQGIALGSHEVVEPELDAPLKAGSVVRISRVVHWRTQRKEAIAQRTIHEIDFALPPGKTKIVRHGSPGELVTMVDYTQTNGTLRKRIIQKRMLRKPKPRIVAEGVGAAGRIAAFTSHGLEKTAYIASRAMEMVATAYTAECTGCSGYTAIGYHAGRGIVAVDPSVIPLGTKLYIPGYGFAIAGDTGGAILGDRIDLGFDSIGDAMEFGRRVVKVYTLH